MCTRLTLYSAHGAIVVASEVISLEHRTLPVITSTIHQQLEKYCVSAMHNICFEHLTNQAMSDIARSLSAPAQAVRSWFISGVRHRTALACTRDQSIQISRCIPSLCSIDSLSKKNLLRCRFSFQPVTTRIGASKTTISLKHLKVGNGLCSKGSPSYKPGAAPGTTFCLGQSAKAITQESIKPKSFAFTLPLCSQVQ